jgi:hypothetical protein
LQEVIGVILGGTLGHALCTGLAVVGGRFIAQRISIRTGGFSSFSCSLKNFKYCLCCSALGGWRSVHHFCALGANDRPWWLDFIS